MKKIFWGFFILYIGLTLGGQNSVIDSLGNTVTYGSNASFRILPEFVGWIFILRGLAEIESYSDRFQRIQLWVKIMIILEFMLMIAGLFGFGSDQNTVSSFYAGLNLVIGIIEIGSGLLALVTQYVLFKGIEEMQNELYLDLRGDKLVKEFKIVIGLNVAVFVLVFYVPLLLAAMVAIIIFNIRILIHLNHAAKTYQEAGLTV